MNKEWQANKEIPEFQAKLKSKMSEEPNTQNTTTSGQKRAAMNHITHEVSKIVSIDLKCFFSAKCLLLFEIN